GQRTIRATLPGVAEERLVCLPGVARAERRGEAVSLVCTDSDATIRAFLAEFPDALYIEIAGPNRHVHDLGGSGISAPVYFMVSLISFGTMNAVIGAGARISAER